MFRRDPPLRHRPDLLSRFCFPPPRAKILIRQFFPESALPSVTLPPNNPPPLPPTGISCGPRSELFCFSCGDQVYHPAVDAEVERVDVCRRLPRLGYGPRPLRRSYDPLSFLLAPDGRGVIWRGMRAAYPPAVPAALVEAGRAALRRAAAFGDGTGGGYGGGTVPGALWGPRETPFALRPGRREGGRGE